ncbi:hypothetical protein AB0C27_40540 [Nonomuraea sp. NPDC048882]|uniref:hypothetical protein n=1 Tax=Nonomuraea sp. NPDC048882 TaxID=3154347 RepID=UPI0033EAE49D
MALWVCSGCSTRYAPGLEACPHCASCERVEEGGGGSRLPFLDVACGNADCPAFAVVRRVYLRSPAPGVVEVPKVLRCVRCWLAMPALAGSMEESMPKITRHGGASNARDAVPATGGVVGDVTVVGEDDPQGLLLPEREHPGVPMKGVEVPANGTESPEITGDGTGEALPPIEQEGAGPSAGSSSETSAGKPPSSGATTNPVRPKRARTTANRSPKARTANSTASSTDGSGEADTL